MVVQGQIEIKLVAADDKEFQFPEHVKHGITYVEAEPKAEYFVAVRRHGSTQADLKALTCNIAVDDQDLGVGMIFYQSPGWGYLGLTDGDTFRALKFVTPRATANDGGSNTEELETMPMGKITVSVVESDVLGSIARGSTAGVSNQLKTPKVSGVLQEELVKKKFIGCTRGLASQAMSMSSYQLANRRLIDTVVIRYATFHALHKNGIYTS